MSRRLATILAVLLTLACAGVQAGPRERDGRFARPPRFEGPVTLSLDEAVAEARARTGGRILSAEPVEADGRRGYRIKVLTPDQRVRVIHLDAER